MAKIVSFTKSSKTLSNQTRGHALDAFVDDDDLLEFSQSVEPQSHGTPDAHDQTCISIFASDWSNQELADLYRAYSLVQSAQPGLECDRGVSDEGDPWFLIGDDTGDVLVHICRIKGTYILDSVGLSKPLRGRDFNALIKGFLTTAVGDKAQDTQDTDTANEPTNVVRLARGGTVCLHPSMMIAALVWTLLMKADELTLPPPNGTSHQALDQKPGEDQDTALQNDDVSSQTAAAMITADMADKGHLAKSEKLETDGAGFHNDLHTGAIPAQFQERDEKTLHVSTYSNALTTIAIAVGFYATAEASSIFWKSTLDAMDKSVTFGDADAFETSDLNTPVDHLSDALALLSSVVDLVVFESDEDYATQNRDADDESANVLDPEGTQAIEASIGQQMLVMASEVFNTLADASPTKEPGAPAKNIENKVDFEAANTMSGDMFTGVYGTDGATTAKAQGPNASIEGLTGVFASSGINVSRYDASSFSTGIGKFDGALEKYSSILEDSLVSVESGSTLSSDIEDTSTDTSHLNAFDAAARSFIDSKLANADLEILAFRNEIIFVDKAAFSGNNTSVSWQLEDGGIVSMIGLSSDMQEFLVA